MHYLYNHITGGRQLTGALLLMILLYNLYDIENRVFTCRNQYYINRVNEIGPVESLLKLLGSENDISVRAEADGALQALSSRLDSAKRSLVDADGFPVFISAILVPSKEFSCGAPVQALQENAMDALANISGGMSCLVHSLGDNIRSCRNDVQVTDIIGALTYALKVFNE
jgi:hypothetical protein